jgi:hypothetical protein
MHTHALQLERRLSEHLGQQTYREAGLGPPPDIDTLHRRVDELLQHNIALQLRLDERDGELTAARAANRERMIKVNSRESECPP